MESALRKLRRSRGWSQDELARRAAALAPTAGFRQKKISQLEAGAQTMDVVELAALARALGVAPAELLEQSADGLADGDAVLYAAPPEGDRLIAALAPGNPRAFWVRVDTDAMNLRGVMPGDYLICVAANDYQPGDTVIANVADPETGAVETLVRELGDGFLRPVSANPRHAPARFDPDDQRVAIMGRALLRVGGDFAEAAAAQHAA